jgi:hypothetical protein
LQGNNSTKDGTLKTPATMGPNEIESLWMKYDKNHDNKLNKKEALKFIKSFTRAVGAPYDKKRAKQIIK